MKRFVLTVTLAALLGVGLVIAYAAPSQSVMKTDRNVVEVQAAVSAVLNEEGRLELVQIAESTGEPELDAYLIEQSENLHYSPPRDTAGERRMPIIQRTMFRIAQGHPMAGGKLLKQVQPSADVYPDTKASVVLAASLDDKGRVLHTDVRTSSGNEECDRTVMDLVQKQWEFEPAHDVKGKAVASKFLCVIYFGYPSALIE